MAPLAQATLRLNARATKQDVLGELPFYHGDIRAKVDALILAQDLTAQSNASVVMNAYKSVVFDHMQQINEGKIKERGSAAVGSSSGTGGHSGSDSDKTEEELSTDEKFYAAKLGVSEADWKAQKKEIAYV